MGISDTRYVLQLLVSAQRSKNEHRWAKLLLVIVHWEVEAEGIKQMVAIYIEKRVLNHKIASAAERFMINFQCCEQETSGLGVLQWANGGHPSGCYVMYLALNSS